VQFNAVELLKDGSVMWMCRVGEDVVSVPPRRTLPGTTLSQTGDRGSLVIPREVALNLGLI
jgi:hypothetical protein